MMTRRRFPLSAIVGLLFLFSCLVCLALTGLTWLRNEILATDVTLLASTLAKLYATPVSVSIGATLAARRSHALQPAALLLIYAAVLMWNLIVLAEFGALAFTSTVGTKEVMSFCDQLNERWTFLLSGLLAFMVGKTSGDKQ